MKLIQRLKCFISGHKWRVINTFEFYLNRNSPFTIECKDCKITAEVFNYDYWAEMQLNFLQEISRHHIDILSKGEINETNTKT